jgi:hypothetical protein
VYLQVYLKAIVVSIPAGLPASQLVKAAFLASFFCTSLFVQDNRLPLKVEGRSRELHQLRRLGDQ